MSAKARLSTYDNQQAAMMQEECIMVDDQDVVLGPISKYDAHRGGGQLHRAFSVLLFDTSNRLLLQQRAVEKITFPGIWANSCCSHPLHTPAELIEAGSAGVISAAIRKMDQELGIAAEQLDGVKFHFLGRMHYLARADEDWVEHEMDHVIVLRADVDIDANKNEIAAIRWVDSADLEEMCGDPNHVMAPWFLGIKQLFLDDWWPEGEFSSLPFLEEIQHLGELQ